jgi:hypothetical protein
MYAEVIFRVFRGATPQSIIGTLGHPTKVINRKQFYRSRLRDFLLIDVKVEGLPRLACHIGKRYQAA